MSLHVILEAIRDAGKAKILEIESRAYTQAGEILRNAQLEAQGIQEQACSSALEPVFKERARILHQARLEALQRTGGARNGLVEKALEQVHGRLSEIRTDVIYPQVLEHLLVEALAELDEEDPGCQAGQPHPAVCLEADPRDRQLLEDLLNSQKLDLQVSYPLKCWGGLIARSENGRVDAINTLEARLEKSAPYLRRYLAALFEDERSKGKQDRAIERKIAYATEESS